MNKHSFFQTAVRGALITASLTASIGLTVINAHAADEPAPQAHSDGISAMFNDTAITAKVKSKLSGDDRLNKSDVEVTTTNGVVTLEGSANSSEAKALAADLSKLVEGVKSVDNNLKIPANSQAEANTRDAMANTERVASDSWITTKVKSEILADNVSKGFNVSVKTTQGVVVLSGALASQDGIDHVKAIAAKVSGVKSVDVSALHVSSH
jgi:hyperosmotically inducible protein